MRLYTGVAGGTKNVVTLKEKNSHEEPLADEEQVYLLLLVNMCL